MRGLSRHSGPNLLAIRSTPCSQSICARHEHHADQNRLQNRNENETTYERCVPVMNGADAGLDDRSVLTVQLQYVVARLLRADGRREWKIRLVCRPALLAVR